MLKGKMKIEMTDVRTGKKETVLEQNMVTNALANIFKHARAPARCPPPESTGNKSPER